MPYDGNGNEITVHETGLTLDGEDLLVVRLVNEPDRGYIAADEGGGGFGNQEHPSSYRMGCVSWFGSGEFYPDPETALARMADRPVQERGEDGLYPV